MDFPLTVFIGHADLDTVDQFICNRAVKGIKMRILRSQCLLFVSICHACADIPELFSGIADASTQLLFLAGEGLPEQRVVRCGNQPVSLVLIQLYEPVLRGFVSDTEP